jgi:hypothetical protein
MSQQDLFGTESYRNTRKPVRGQRCNRAQLALFPLVVKRAVVTTFKRGQKYLVEQSQRVVTFMRHMGSTSLWECDGDLYRATAAQVTTAGVRRLL